MTISRPRGRECRKRTPQLHWFLPLYNVAIGISSSSVTIDEVIKRGDPNQVKRETRGNS